MPAFAGPVVCDERTAVKILTDARIEEARAPISHPELIPGLALASENVDLELLESLRDLCAPGGSLSLSEAEAWSGPAWSAHTFLLTRSEMQDCTQRERTIAISVGVPQSGKPRYSLRTRLSATRTPVGDCATLPRWREESVIDGEDGPLRLVLITDHEGDKQLHSEVALRSASPNGWRERRLVEPAPARLLDGAAGPRVELTERYEEKWVVAYGNRTGTPPACEAIPGQTVWTPASDWTPLTGDEALRRLAERGLWRMTGSDGWFVIVAQDDEAESQQMQSRSKRLEKRSGSELLVLPSAWFPGLNPGFLIATFPPVSTEAEANALRSTWRPRRQAYVKRAWTAPDPCAL